MCQPQIVRAIASHRMKKKSIYDYRTLFPPFALITFQQMIESARLLHKCLFMLWPEPNKFAQFMRTRLIENQSNRTLFATGIDIGIRCICFYYANVCCFCGGTIRFIGKQILIGYYVPLIDALKDLCLSFEENQFGCAPFLSLFFHSFRVSLSLSVFWWFYCCCQGNLWRKVTHYRKIEAILSTERSYIIRNSAWILTAIKHYEIQYERFLVWFNKTDFTTNLVWFQRNQLNDSRLSNIKSNENLTITTHFYAIRFFFGVCFVCESGFEWEFFVVISPFSSWEMLILMTLWLLLSFERFKTDKLRYECSEEMRISVIECNRYNPKWA